MHGVSVNYNYMAMKKITDAKDKLGNSVEVWFSENLQYTPVIPLFLKTWAELVEKNWALPTFAFKTTNRVVWIQGTDGVVQAGIAYEYYPDQKSGWLVLSFTDPAYRGRGLNQLCHRYYEADCRRLGAVMLSGLISVDNKSALAAAAKTGRIPKFYRVHKDLDPVTGNSGIVWPNQT